MEVYNYINFIINPAQMEVTPSTAGPYIKVTSTATKLYYTVVKNDSILIQSSVNSGSNTWDFSKWNLSPGNYRFELQGVNNGYIAPCQIYSFTIGYSTSISIKTLPGEGGPKIWVNSNGTRLYYTLIHEDGTVVIQSSVASGSNYWNFALWNLAPGKYKFEAQAVKDGVTSPCHTYSFTIIG